MRKLGKKLLGMIFVCAMLLSLAACGSDSETKTSVNTSEIAGDYYIDLTELGMKLTLYLRLDENGGFLFSPTLDFDVNKSSGTFQKSDGLYVMVYDSVNGEEKSVSDGLTSSFEVMEDGSLDFSSCDCIYYGSATASAKSAEKPDVKLIAHPVAEDYEEADLTSPFQRGVYLAETSDEAGNHYHHAMTFYEDGTYMQMTYHMSDGHMTFFCEAGIYGVSTTQLALTPENTTDTSMGGRIECTVVDDSHIEIAILENADAAERTTHEFVRTDETQVIAQFSGNDDLYTEMTLYNDGSYAITADDFTETGILVLVSDSNYMKQYPDHPETAVRGLSQVATVPYGVLTEENGTLVLSGLRVRTSESFSRTECRVIQK